VTDAHWAGRFTECMKWADGEWGKERACKERRSTPYLRRRGVGRGSEEGSVGHRHLRHEEQVSMHGTGGSAL